MKRGRPSKDFPWEDKDIIPIRLSFNQIKYLLIKFRNFRTDSMEGNITQNILNDFRLYLDRQDRKNKLPQSIIDKLNEEDNEETSVNDDTDGE